MDLYTSLHLLENLSNCKYCDEKLKNPFIINCKHIYCKECIDNIFMNDRKPVCKICNAKITKSAVIRYIDNGALMENIEHLITELKAVYYKNDFIPETSQSDKNLLFSQEPELFKNTNTQEFDAYDFKCSHENNPLSSEENSYVTDRKNLISQATTINNLDLGSDFYSQNHLLFSAEISDNQLICQHLTSSQDSQCKQKQSYDGSKIIHHTESMIRITNHTYIDCHKITLNYQLIFDYYGKYSIIFRNDNIKKIKFNNSIQQDSFGNIKNSLDVKDFSSSLDINQASLSNNDSKLEQKQSIHLVYSRLNKKQSDIIQLFCKKFCVFQSKEVDNTTTHLIINTDDLLFINRSSYTYKYIISIVKGLFVVSFKWIEACLKENRILDEIEFIVKGDIEADEQDIPKLALSNKCQLFIDRKICITGKFDKSLLSSDQLKNIVVSCGGVLVDDYQSIDMLTYDVYLVIDDPNDIDVKYITCCSRRNIPIIKYEWIIESVACLQLLNIEHFLLESNI